MTSTTPDLIKAYIDRDALGLAELVRSKGVTPAELTEVAISLIEDLDPKLNAVVIRSFETARTRANKAPGEGPFAGVPYLLKNIGWECEGMPMTAGLEYRKNYVSAHAFPHFASMTEMVGASATVRAGLPDGRVVTSG